MINVLKLNAISQHRALGRIYEILIDGAPLVDMFEDFEARYSSKINGSYADALCEEEVKGALCEVGRRFMPLGCTCGISECWFVTGEVLTFDQYVCWGRWENPYRNQRDRKLEGLYWSYKDFPAIVFEKAQYQQAIAQALSK